MLFLMLLVCGHDGTVLDERGGISQSWNLWRRHIINLHAATILIFDKARFNHKCVPHCEYNCKFKQPTWSTCNIILIRITYINVIIYM